MLRLFRLLFTSILLASLTAIKQWQRNRAGRVGVQTDALYEVDFFAAITLVISLTVTSSAVRWSQAKRQAFMLETARLL